MTWLALDTATDRPTLALGAPRGERKTRVIGHRHDLSRDLDSAVRGLLSQAGIPASGLAGVVVADGPGSFTGLRIGLAFAKGLCRAGGLPLHVAPSMLGAARSAAPGGGLVLVEYDALRGDVYRALYRLGSAVETLATPVITAVGTPAPLLASGAARASESDASADALLDLVEMAGGTRQVEAPAGFEPDYGRLAEAEARRLARGR